MPLYKPEDIDTLAARGDIKALIKALRDVETSNLAKSALIEIGEPAVRPLVKALRDGSVCFIASQVLKEIGYPAVGPLVKALEDRRGSGFAAAVLEDIGEPAVSVLIDALKGDEERTRILAVRALGVIGDRRAISPIQAEIIENLLAETSLTLHEVCIQALEDLGVSYRYEGESELILEDFIRGLETLGYSKSSRSKKLFTFSKVPSVRFQVLKRIVRLESRYTEGDKQKEWTRVRSYSIKNELRSALKIAELVVTSVG